MISFKKIKGPFNIPIYFQRLPDMVNSVSFSWTMFVGGVDDESIGKPGLYHWFEHVPFRGTKKYPQGSREIKSLCTSHGGRIGAYTHPFGTTYYATVPLKIWKEALSRITDLMSQPLLTEEAVDAEREIIIQEIEERTSKSIGRVYYDIGKILYPNHALGHHVLGSEESLRSMNTEVLRKAHEANYDRSRCIFTAVGNIDSGELVAELEKLCSDIPDRGLSERRSPPELAPLPEWKKGLTTVIETAFVSSHILMLFPLPHDVYKKEKYRLWNTLSKMVAFGFTDSPLLRILREDRKLVYHARIFDFYSPVGGYWGFVAETQGKNIDFVLQAFKDVMIDPEITSQERLDAIKTGVSGNVDISPIDANKYREQAIEYLMKTGRILNDSEYLEELNQITTSNIQNLLKDINIADAHTIIFKGKN